MAPAQGNPTVRKKYNPSDPNVCHSCRDFQELDFSNAPKSPTLLPAFRKTAAKGCLRCNVLVAGIDKFDYFWKGTEEDQTSWPEEEIRISVWPQQDDPMQIILTRRVKDEERYETLELEFYSHAGESNTLINTCQPSHDFTYLADEPNPFPEFRAAGDVPEYSDSDASFATIRGWIELCESQHEMCNMRQTSDEMPTRLIYVGTEGDAPRLCLTSDMAPTKYAALSHSWGSRELRKKPIPKTNRANIGSRMDGISWQELTKTFQDAIIITRRLGLGHIWIDSMCIVQDDEDDWTLEASRMALNYQNAHLVIAATRSQTGDQGCFSRRSPSHRISLSDVKGYIHTVYVKKEISHRDFAESPATFNTMPLFARAWVFQERLLARRVVHYTKNEIMWECNQSLFCECQGIESGRDWSHGKNTGNFKLDHGKLLAAGSSTLRRYQHWSKIVAEYSVRSLAYDSDRLPALSGIAGQMHSREMGRYLAGIWENSLPQALLWKTMVGIVEKNWEKRRPTEYRAPSWSWVSVEAECRTWIPDSEDEATFHCRILDVQCTLASHDPHGHISDGFLVLSAPVFWARFKYEQWRDNREEPKYMLHFNGQSEMLAEDVPLENKQDSIPDESSVLVAVIVSRLVPSEADRHKPLWKGIVPNRRWEGIALKDSPRRKHAYERIGSVGGRSKHLPDQQIMDITIV
ncbi:hypothetical protein PV08_06706 [Exophiala spinifera]|uniref:Heterokaryon incompatibility domain-containing protein n=1 Tax=Exophiala spinifera TaxID=91928 RepID=A0A0D2B5F7_9EURO|nr:uncharacterized protein PV08_06706 [Exophiala spinifera]KIW13925.1 hypothetical protein PV08_06706 [Exophiala spinifera]